MRPSQALALHRARIRQIALSHHVQDIRVFGSALHGDDIEGSDLEPTVETTLFDIGAIRFELKQLLGVNIDVLTPNSLPDEFRTRVMEEAQQV
jgi:predicted nucleotidyltransferase